MSNIPHISSPYSEPWVAWTLLLLLVIALFSQSAQRNPLTDLRNIFSQSERHYGSNTQNWAANIAALLFRWGVLSLTVYLIVYQPGCFTLLNYVKVLGVVAAVFCVQTLVTIAVGQVFLQPKQREVIAEQYSYIRNLTTILLWMVLLVMTNIPGQLALYILVGITALLFSGVVLGKGIRLFYRKPLSLFYILLYFISLEAIPLAGIFTWAKQIV